MIQVMIAIFGLSAVGLSQGPNRFQRWAPVMGLIGQPFWFVAMYQSQQWGVFILCFAYTALWGMGFYRQWLR